MPKSIIFSLERIAARAIGAIMSSAANSFPANVPAAAAARAAAPANFCAARLFFFGLWVITIAFFSVSRIFAFEPVIGIIPFFFTVRMFCTYVLLYIIEQSFLFVKGFLENLFDNFSQKNSLNFLILHKAELS